MLCTQGLSALIQNRVIDNSLHGIDIARGSPTISHLFFADDSLVFSKAIAQDCTSLKECLQLYECVSGQLINYDKSTVIFSQETPRSS